MFAVIRLSDRVHRFAGRLPDRVRAELADFGAWDAEELADDDANWRRLVWSAAWNIAEEEGPDCSASATPKTLT